MIVLENDLYRKCPKEDVESLWSHCKEIVVLDHLHNETTNKASVLIPVGTFAEADGTLVNNEGRAQRFFQVFMPKNDNLRESWRWLDEFRQFKNGQGLEDLQPAGNLLAAMAAEMPQFSGVENVAPAPDFRIVGQKIPREPHRYSGRTAMFANINVSEQKPPEDIDSPLSFTMEGYKGMPPATLTPFFWAPGWNSVQSVNKYQVEIGGPLKGGHSGKRLFSEVPAGEIKFFDALPPAAPTAAEEWLIIPLPHIFGSDELSLYSPPIAERSAKPYIAINKQAAEHLNTSENEMLRLQIGTHRYDLPVKIKKEIPDGLAGIPAQLPGLYGISLPAKGLLRKPS